MNRIKALCLAAAAGTLALTGQAASGASITPTDWDSIVGGLGAPVAGPITTDFIGLFGGSDVGDLTSAVYSSGGTYYYELTVSPTAAMANISVFNTHAGIGGYLGIAGYSFADALAAGVGFTIEYESDGSYDWNESPPGSGAWDGPESITFFFASTLPPAGLDQYGLTDGQVAAAMGFTVVPLPAAAWGGLALMGAIGTSQIRKRRKEVAL